MKWRVALIALALLAGLFLAVSGPMLAWVSHGGTPPTKAEIRDLALSGALSWLWRQQASDGLLRAEQHAQLRRGESVTAAALLATSMCAPRFVDRYREDIDEALEALVVGSARDASLDYPSYTISYHLHALTRLRPPEWAERAGELLSHLRTLQCSPANGWRSEQPAFGGFGLGDGVPRTAEAASLVTLSTTVAALAAARAVGVDVEDPLVQHARVFVERCQNYPGDGGFFGAPTAEWRGGKGGSDSEGRKRSYGTATADGVRALELCGADQERVVAAFRWLAIHDQPEVPGLLPEFEPGLRLYWAAALSQAGKPAPWILEFHWLRSRWRKDGAFVGLTGIMKEDDPVVATILAIRALATH